MADPSDVVTFVDSDGNTVRAARSMLSPEFLAKHEAKPDAPAPEAEPTPAQGATSPGMPWRQIVGDSVRQTIGSLAGPVGSAINGLEQINGANPAVRDERSKQAAVGGVVDDLSHGQVGRALGRLILPNSQAAETVNSDRYNAKKIAQTEQTQDAQARDRADLQAQRDSAQSPVASQQSASPVARSFRPVVDTKLNDAVAMQQDAVRQATEAGAAKANEEYGYQQEAMKRQADLELERQKMVSAYQQHRQDSMDKLQQMNAEFSKQQVDPNRFWASRDNGQKVMAAIATALGGFAGNNNASQIIQGAIRDDIDAQKANIEIKGQAGKNQQSILGMMREHFGDDVLAQNAAEAALLAQTQARITSLTSKYGSADVKAKGQELIGQLQQSLQEKQQAAAQNVEKNAQEWAKISVERQKVAASVAKGGPRPIDSATTATLSKLQAAIDAVGEARKSFNGVGKNAVVSRISPNSDASKYDSSTAPMSIMIGEALKGGNLRGPEHELYQKMLPTSTTPRDAGNAKFNVIEKQLKSELANRLEAMKKGGQGTGGYGIEDHSVSKAFQADDGEAD